ncbi:MAG: dTMP kinase [Saprospiraceae bacterium]
MPGKSIFIVIEGLDGSGKTTASQHLAELLESHFPGKTLRTYEPHDPSCGGDYIRQVLRKEITAFQPRTLALAFAANRLDHGDRIVTPWLAGDSGRIVLCDRYYLSSLVYQQTSDFPMENVLELNQLARKPDVIFFLNVSNEVCYERMKGRNLPPELFEENLSETRRKYQEAIEFLRKGHQENIVEIDGNGTVDQTATAMFGVIISMSE